MEIMKEVVVAYFTALFTAILTWERAMTLKTIIILHASRYECEIEAKLQFNRYNEAHFIRGRIQFYGC
jgi:hypothetical protein